MRAVAAAVVREPLDRMRERMLAKATLNALHHQIADHLAADPAGAGAPGNSLTVAGIEDKGGTNHLAVLEGDLKTVRGPAKVRPDRNNLAVVSTARRISHGLIAQRSESEIIQHQQIGFGELPEQCGASLHCGVARVPRRGVVGESSERRNLHGTPSARELRLSSFCRRR